MGASKLWIKECSVIRAEGLDANPSVTSIFRKGREILKKKGLKEDLESLFPGMFDTTRGLKPENCLA